MNEPNQVEYADLLADELNACDDYDIRGINILDTLGSTGLKLVKDDDGDATIAYHAQFSSEDS